MFRLYGRASLLLFLTALAVLVGDQYVAPVRAALERVAYWKVHYGYGFSFVSTACFGGLLPLLLQHLQSSSPRTPLSELPFLLMFWGLKGLEVDALYRLQAWFFGADLGLLGLIAKVSVDQLVYVPLWAIPSTVAAFQWKDERFRRFPKVLHRSWFVRHVRSILIANWLVWIPAVAVIYCLRQPLQLPLQNLVLCLWSLFVLLFLGRREPDQEDLD